MCSLRGTHLATHGLVTGFNLLLAAVYGLAVADGLWNLSQNNKFYLWMLIGVKLLHACMESWIMLLSLRRWPAAEKNSVRRLHEREFFRPYLSIFFVPTLLCQLIILFQVISGEPPGGQEGQQDAEKLFLGVLVGSILFTVDIFMQIMLMVLLLLHFSSFENL